MLKPDAVSHTDRRAIFVGADAYQAAGVRITADLFAEKRYFDDVAILDDLFGQRLAAAAEALESEGWKWAGAVTASYIGYSEIEDRKLDRIHADEGTLSAEAAERYDELAELAGAGVLDDAGAAELAGLQAILDGTFTDAQKALAGCLIHVDGRGELAILPGLVAREDREAAIAAGFLRASAHSTDATAPKSPISQKLRDDLDRVALGARQHAALRDPDLLIALLAYQLSHDLHWNRPFGIALDDVPTTPGTGEAGYALDPRLAGASPRDGMMDKDLGRSFRAFRAKGADHVRGELVRFLAAQFRGGSGELAAMIEKITRPDIREVWTPTAANFFGRVSGGTLDDLWRELLDLKPDHPTVTTFAKMKKAEKAAKLEALFAGDADLHAGLHLTDAQVARIAAWLPEGME